MRTSRKRTLGLVTTLLVFASAAVVADESGGGADSATGLIVALGCAIAYPATGISCGACCLLSKNLGIIGNDGLASCLDMCGMMMDPHPVVDP